MAIEERSPIRHEYVAGRMYAMSGASRNHSRIITNIVLTLGPVARERRCDLHIESVKLQVRDDVIYYPDVVIACDPSDDDPALVRQPCLLVEVTSPSTASTDRREKLANYRELPSLRTYLVVDQRRRRVEHHWREADGTWWHATLSGDEHIPVPCLDVELALDDVYHGITFPAVSEPEPPEYELDALDEALL